MLHPAAADYAEPRKSNNLSCVLRIEAGGKRMLLTSDIEARDEAAMLQRDPAALAAEVLLVPHHGSRTSSTPEFIAAVGAQHAVIPVGYRNRFGHPKAEVDRTLRGGRQPRLAHRPRRRGDYPPRPGWCRVRSLAAGPAALLAGRERRSCSATPLMRRAIEINL